jgi:rod shape-determining protein MreB
MPGTMRPQGRLKRFLDRIGKRFQADLAIDLGTVSTLIYVRNEGIVVHEPSVIAVDTRTRKTVALGRAANRLAERPPDHVRVIRPLDGGVIADPNAAMTMMAEFIRIAFETRPPSRLRLVIAVPAGMTSVEKRAVMDSAYEAGARTVFFLNGLMASAMGAGLDVETSSGMMVAGVGGGATEAAVISLGSVVQSESVRIGGDDMDEAIMRYLWRALRLQVTRKLAEEIKVRIGCAVCPQHQQTITVMAKQVGERSPRTVTITSSQISEALERPVDMIIDTVRRTLENAPPNLLADIRDRGIVLTGGGSLLAGLDDLIGRMTGLPAVRAVDSLTSAVRGCGMAVEDLPRWQRLFEA